MTVSKRELNIIPEGEQPILLNIRNAEEWAALQGLVNVLKEEGFFDDDTSEPQA